MVSCCAACAGAPCPTRARSCQAPACHDGDDGLLEFSLFCRSVNAASAIVWVSECNDKGREAGGGSSGSSCQQRGLPEPHFRVAAGRATVDSSLRCRRCYSKQPSPCVKAPSLLLCTTASHPSSTSDGVKTVCPVASAALGVVPCSPPLWSAWKFQAITSHKSLVTSDLAPIHSS